MATTVHEPPQVEPRRPSGPKDSGNGGWRNLVPANGDLRAGAGLLSAAASTGIWVVLFGITMTFAAFTSALIVRKGGIAGLAGFHLAVDSLLQHRCLLLASSVTLEIARHRVASFMGRARSQAENPARWLYITLSWACSLWLDNTWPGVN